jgi:hypothetical protein
MVIFAALVLESRGWLGLWEVSERIFLSRFCTALHCSFVVLFFSLGCDERIYHYAICAMNDQRCVSLPLLKALGPVMCSRVKKS